MSGLGRLANSVRRNSGLVVFILTLLIAALFVAGLWRRQIVSLAWLASNKDGIGAASSIASTALLIVGATFAYFRFFRGRTLALRAELQLSAVVHPTKQPHLIHAITLKVKNVGGSTIWHPTPRLRFKCYGQAADSATGEIAFSDVTEAPSEMRDTAAASFSVIETEETVSFFAVREVPEAVWVAVYKATLTADSGDVWTAYCSVANVAKKDAPDPKDGRV